MFRLTVPETTMFASHKETYLDLEGGRKRVKTSLVTQTLIVKDRPGNHLLLITQEDAPQAVFPATDLNIELVLRAGLRIHEYLMLDGQIEYRETAESSGYFEGTTPRFDRTTALAA
jgi:hypothetical protein